MENKLTLKDREAFGRNVALVMALKKVDPPLNDGPALPEDAQAISKRLQILSQDITSSHADLSELLVRFDDATGWKCNGSKHCAAWANSVLGISDNLCWEYLRVGRKLKTLTILRAFFRVGKISWSKARLISRVADENNEDVLCHAALDASVSDVKRLCDEYRWNKESNTATEIATESAQAMQQWLSRSFTWTTTSNGNTKIQITLPPELAQVFLNNVEQSLSQIEIETKDENQEENQDQDQTGTKFASISQRRADAAVLMAEKSLQSEGRDIATADRFQVVVSVDAAELKKADASVNAQQDDSCVSNTSHIPKKRATVQNAGAIARETARRIACDCSISVIHTENGEPINIGRKTRIWTTAIARAIKNRDQGCVWPGCTQSRYLHIHHIKHWADGGETSVSNGACLCSHHHAMVHEGDYTIINTEVEKNAEEQSMDTLLDTQFFQQLNTADTAQFEFEKELRHDYESFNTVRKLMPSVYRFRVFNADGIDVRYIEPDGLNEPTRVGCREDVGEYSIPLNFCPGYEQRTKHFRIGSRIAENC